MGLGNFHKKYSCTALAKTPEKIILQGSHGELIERVLPTLTLTFKRFCTSYFLHKAAAPVVRAAVKTDLSYRNETIIYSHTVRS